MTDWNRFTAELGDIPSRGTRLDHAMQQGIGDAPLLAIGQ